MQNPRTVMDMALDDYERTEGIRRVVLPRDMETLPHQVCCLNTSNVVVNITVSEDMLKFDTRSNHMMSVWTATMRANVMMKVMRACMRTTHTGTLAQYRFTITVMGARSACDALAIYMGTIQSMRDIKKFRVLSIRIPNIVCTSYSTLMYPNRIIRGLRTPALVMWGPNNERVNTFPSGILVQSKIRGGQYPTTQQVLNYQPPPPSDIGEAVIASRQRVRNRRSKQAAARSGRQVNICRGVAEQDPKSILANSLHLLVYIPPHIKHLFYQLATESTDGLDEPG